MKYCSIVDGLLRCSQLDSPATTEHYYDKCSYLTKKIINENLKYGVVVSSLRCSEISATN